MCKSVKHFLPLYDTGNKGLPWQAVACTPATTAILHRWLQPHSWGKASKQKLPLSTASLLQPGQVILPAYLSSGPKERVKIMSLLH